MTGVEFFRYLNQAIDKAYSAYLQNDEANRLINTALHNMAEKKYRGYVDQKAYDEIDTLIVTNLTQTVINDTINLFPFQVTNVTLTGGGTIVTITTFRRHFLSVGNTVTVSGVLGDTVTNINGTFPIATVPSETTFTYVVVGGVLTNYTANSGQVVSANTLSNYWHLFAIRPILAASPTLSVTGVKTGTTTEVTSANHNLRTGDIVTITGLGGVTGTFASVEVTVINKNIFSVAVSSTGTYTSGGTVTRIVSEYATPYTSDRKKSVLYAPTVNDPRAETAEGYIKLYPSGASSAVIDYMRTPYVPITVTDTVIDLEDFYKAKTLFLLIDECVALFSMEARDEGRMNTALQDMSINP